MAVPWDRHELRVATTSAAFYSTYRIQFDDHGSRCLVDAFVSQKNDLGIPIHSITTRVLSKPDRP